MPLTRVPIPSPNYSSRSGAKVRLIVLHTAEGALTYQSLGSYFSSPSSGVSSHVGIDDTPNTVGEYVQRPNKAWTAANANPVAVQAEMCAFAAWSTAQWNTHPNMLANVAAWIAEEAAHFGIPIVKLSASQAQGSSSGVCQHRDLGTWGGNHSDCGNGFPIDDVLKLATGTTPPTPTISFPYFSISGEEDPTTVAVCTHPSGKRMDLVSVNPDSTVNHSWTDNNAKWTYNKNLGGTAKSVSCCWLDGNRYVVIVHGSNDVPYQNTNTNGKWSGWGASPNIKLKPI